MTTSVLTTAPPFDEPLPRRRVVRAARLWAPRAPIPRRWRVVLVACSVLVPLLAWVLASATGAVPTQFLPSPAAVWQAGLEMAKSGTLATDTWASVQRILIGFGLAIVPHLSVMDEEKNKQLAVIQLAEKEWVRPVGVIYRSDRQLSIAAKKFVQLLENGALNN